MYHRGGCQAVGSELHRSPPAAMEDGKSWPRIIDREGWGFKAIFLHTGTHTETEGEWHAVRLVWKRLVFYPNSVTKPTNQSINILQLLCLCLAITITAYMAGAAAGSVSLLPEDTQSPDTNPGQRKGAPDGNMPRLHCLQVSLVSRSGRNGNIFSACNESVAPKVSWHFFLLLLLQTNQKKQKQSCFLSPLYNNPQISLGYTPLC